MGGGSKRVTIGYKYYLGMHMVICHGPVDAVTDFVVGERTAWSGNITASTSVYVNNPNLFGGEKKEGGIQGTVDVMMGEATQAKNGYLQSKLGALIPAFRGVVSIVLRRVYVVAMNPYPKAWAIRAKRMPGRSWYAATCDINNGSANPIHVIYETLTNRDWGMGYPAVSAIDDTSFRAAALICFNEGLGVSMLLTGQDSIEKFIYQVLNHANGALYTDPTTGQFKIELFRDNYDPNTLPNFSEVNVVKLQSFERPTYAEMVNEVVVVFRPRGGDKDDAITVQDLASIQAQGAVISQTVRYPGIDTAANASRLALRDLRQKSTPLARIKITVNRTAWDLTVGKLFTFTWNDHNLVDLVFRVVKINYGSIQNGIITIDAVEDIFGLPSETYMGDQPSEWLDPVQPPTAFPVQRLEEATYFDMATTVGPGDFQFLTEDSAFLVSYVGESLVYSPSYELWTKTPTGEYAEDETGTPAGYAKLASAITPTTTVLPLTNLSSSMYGSDFGDYAYLGNEIVRVDSVDTVLMTATVGRGCLDTVPTSHVANTVLLLADNGKARTDEEYATGGTLFGKALMRTANDILPIIDATEMTKTFTGRFGRPYPPGNLKVNGVSYPSTVVGPLALTWAHRDRTAQVTVPILDTLAGNVGPEADVTYTVIIYASNGTTVLRTETGLTSAGYDWPTEAADVNIASSTQRIQVKSVRLGKDSHQQHDLTVVRTGIGYNLGNFIGGI